MSSWLSIHLTLLAAQGTIASCAMMHAHANMRCPCDHAHSCAKGTQQQQSGHELKCGTRAHAEPLGRGASCTAIHASTR
eukprot:963100-Prymnesium_polylepis.1